MGVQDSYEACLDAASRYLSYRSRSEAELRAYLKRRGFGNESIVAVLGKLREQGLVNDVGFARFWKENRQAFSPRSRAMLRQELSRKGIGAEIIADVVEEVDEESSAYKAAQKKMKALTGSDYMHFRQKLFTFLRRRGFGYEVCQRTVNQLWREIKENKQDA